MRDYNCGARSRLRPTTVQSGEFEPWLNYDSAAELELDQQIASENMDLICHGFRINTDEAVLVANFKDRKLISKQEHYTEYMAVDPDNGRLYAFGDWKIPEANEELIQKAQTLQFHLVVEVDNQYSDGFTKQSAQVTILGLEDPESGKPQTLNQCVSQRAVSVINRTLQFLEA